MLKKKTQLLLFLLRIVPYFEIKGKLMHEYCIKNILNSNYSENGHHFQLSKEFAK